MAQLRVGDHYPIYLDSARDYDGSPDGVKRLAWEHEIQHPGATYIAVHFDQFQLADSIRKVVLLFAHDPGAGFAQLYGILALMSLCLGATALILPREAR